jgi:hypothetical protein
MAVFLTQKTGAAVRLKSFPSRSSLLRNRGGGRNRMRHLMYKIPRRSVVLGATATMSQTLSPEHIVRARHAGGTEAAMRFADGHEGRVDLTDLGLDVATLRLETMRETSWGGAVELETTEGESITLDAAVLRAYCDPEYANQLAQAIAELAPFKPPKRRDR